MISNPTWPLKKLEECCRYISRGKQPKYVEKSEIKTLNQKAIQWGSIDKKSLKYHNSEIPVAEKHFILKGDLVLNSTGTGTVGRCYYFSEEPTDKIFADSHVTIIRTNKEILLPEFLYYQLSSQQYQKLIYSSFLAGSTGQVELNKSKVQEFPIYTPEIKIQEKIVNILNLLDKKINSNSKIIINLENISQTLFKHWFIDFEFPNEEGKPYKSSGGEMVESELGEIPKKWCSKKFNSIMKISSGKRPKIKADNYSLENSIPIIGASKLMGYTREILFDSPILVIGRVGTHGVVQKIVDRCWPSDNTLVIQSEFYNFVYEFLKVIDYKSLNRGSTQPLITQTDIKNQTIIVPEDLTIMKKFEEILMPLLNKQFLLLKENESLTQLRDTLLPKLLSGEIEIPDNLEV